MVMMCSCDAKIRQFFSSSCNLFKMTQGDTIDFPSRVEPSRPTKDNFFNGNPFNGLDKMTELVTGNHKSEGIKKNHFSSSTTTPVPGETSY